MQKIFQRFGRLVFKFDNANDTDSYVKDSYHLDYEEGIYREGELVKLIRGALPHFALTPSEYNRLKNNDDIDEMYRLAFSRISSAKKDKKGDYGELLLFLILKSYYKSERLVTKVKLRSSAREQIKGFDCAHFAVDDDGGVSLWLGEVKFYKSYSRAISDIFEEIESHLDAKYLKDEFSILYSNIEVNENVSVPDIVIEYLDGSISLNDVKIVIPALVTYETPFFGNYSEVNEVFLDDLKSHFNERFKLIDKRKLNTIGDIEIFFILLPLSDVDKIKSQLDLIEGTYR